MKSIKIMVATLGLGVIALSSTLVQAHTDVSIGIGLPLFRAPVYYAPPPVYYAPPPVYYNAPRVVYEHRVNYPQPVYFGGRWDQRGNAYGHVYERDRWGYRGHDRDHDRDGYRDRDHDGRDDRREGREHDRR